MDRIDKQGDSSARLRARRQQLLTFSEILDAAKEVQQATLIYTGRMEGFE
jgi:hypothetical protein